MIPKTEYSPLLPIGFHPFSLMELRELCVNKFPHSITRNDIMLGLEKVIEMMEDVGLEGDVWIDGSFLTEKINPNDSDIVVFVLSEECESKEKAEVIKNIRSNLRDQFLCHSHIFPEYPKDDDRAVYFEWSRSYWIRQFGFSRGEEIKGIAVYKLKE